VANRLTKPRAGDEIVVGYLMPKIIAASVAAAFRRRLVALPVQRYFATPGAEYFHPDKSRSL